jgi:hypothetical protein
MKVSLKKQEQYLRKQAKKRGLKIRHTPSLNSTPYRAMHPCASKELGIKNPKNTIGYTKYSERPKRRFVMDLRHELIEYDLMKNKKYKYKKAHKIANRKQRSVDAL